MDALSQEDAIIEAFNEVAGPFICSVEGFNCTEINIRNVRGTKYLYIAINKNGDSLFFRLSKENFKPQDEETIDECVQRNLRSVDLMLSGTAAVMEHSDIWERVKMVSNSHYSDRLYFIVKDDGLEFRGINRMGFRVTQQINPEQVGVQFTWDFTEFYTLLFPLVEEPEAPELIAHEFSMEENEENVILHGSLERIISAVPTVTPHIRGVSAQIESVYDTYYTPEAESPEVEDDETD